MSLNDRETPEIYRYTILTLKLLITKICKLMIEDAKHKGEEVG